MRHTVYSDYALRMLMYLALNPERMCTIQEIADAYRISKNHLMKLAHELGKAGYIQTVRGRAGGLRLGRRPEAINLGELLRHTEEDFALVECFQSDRNTCAITPTCILREVFAEALNAYLAVLDRKTLADLMRRPTGLRDLLELSRPAPGRGTGIPEPVARKLRGTPAGERTEHPGPAAVMAEEVEAGEAAIGGVRPWRPRS